jgi:hypothetical protein
MNSSFDSPIRNGITIMHMDVQNVLEDKQGKSTKH